MFLINVRFLDFKDRFVWIRIIPLVVQILQKIKLVKIHAMCSIFVPLYYLLWYARRRCFRSLQRTGTVLLGLDAADTPGLSHASTRSRQPW